LSIGCSPIPGFHGKAFGENYWAGKNTLIHDDDCDNWKAIDVLVDRTMIGVDS
jgi:hypothetical protein